MVVFHFWLIPLDHLYSIWIKLRISLETQTHSPTTKLHILNITKKKNQTVFYFSMNTIWRSQFSPLLTFKRFYRYNFLVYSHCESINVSTFSIIKIKRINQYHNIHNFNKIFWMIWIQNFNFVTALHSIIISPIFLTFMIYW